MEFPEGPITFKLISGNGPVFITGLQAPPDTAADEQYAMDEMTAEEELGDEEEVILANIILNSCSFHSNDVILCDFSSC